MRDFNEEDSAKFDEEKERKATSIIII